MDAENTSLAGVMENAGQTFVHPLGLFAILVLGLCVLLLPRRWSVVPMLVMASFISSGQRFVIIGCDFDFLRIMVLLGVVRLFLRKEYLGFGWRSLDSAMVLWTVSWMLFYIIQYGTSSAIINRLGVGFDAFGMYFLFRCLVRTWQDVDTLIAGIIVISLPVAVFFLLENRTGRNLFAIFGGVAPITWVRDGRLRCQGAFSHAILAGCFWAALLPLITAYWWKSAKAKAVSAVGIMASMIIIICCASSTPVMGVLGGLVGGVFFFLRQRMRIVRWGALLLLLGLHMVMEAPVWHLISRVSAAGGSTGWHRFHLIDQTINNFGDWWFSGCSGQTVLSWGVFAGDVTNQYILMGVTGGIATMGLFITVIVIAFRCVGKLWRSQEGCRYQSALSWALGVSLFVHCVNFIGVSYFGQIYIIWYLLLAIIGSLEAGKTAPTMQKSTVRQFPKRSSGKVKYGSF